MSCPPPIQSFAAYQEAVKRTYQDRYQTRYGEMPGIVVHGFGIAGEAGEVAELLKKCLSRGGELDIAKLREELGDVIWYATAIALDTGLTLEEIVAAQVEKGLRRHPNGFTPESSIARVDQVQTCSCGAPIPCGTVR